MMNDETFSTSYGVAVPFDDIVVDAYEPDGPLPGVVVPQFSYLLSPWQMICASTDGSDPKEFADMFLNFWIARGDTWFMRPGTLLEVSGIAHSYPDFSAVKSYSGLKVTRLMRVLRQSIPSDQSPTGRIAHDFIILICQDGANFGIFSDNSARLGQS